MTTFHKIVLGVALTGAVGLGIYGAHENLKLRGTVQRLQAQQSQLTERVAQLQRERDDATARLAGMADQNDSLRTNAAELLKLRGEVSRLQLDSEELAQIKSGRSAAAVGAANAWADRVTLLKKRLEQTPDAAIPELQYATEKDWLNAARGDLNSDASYRRALSQLRNAGEQTFAVMLQKALKDYLRNNADQMPTDINQLAPFFASPVDPTMLQRWQVVSADSVKGLNMGSDVVITQRSAVDDVFDSRIGIGPNGWGTTDILSREVASTMDPVWQAYRAAHDGQWPDDVSQLQPYAHTPEQLAALQKLILHNTATKEQ